MTKAHILGLGGVISVALCIGGLVYNTAYRAGIVDQRLFNHDEQISDVRSDIKEIKADIQTVLQRMPTLK